MRCKTRLNGVCLLLGLAFGCGGDDSSSGSSGGDDGGQCPRGADECPADDDGDDGATMDGTGTGSGDGADSADDSTDGGSDGASTDDTGGDPWDEYPDPAGDFDKNGMPDSMGMDGFDIVMTRVRTGNGVTEVEVEMAGAVPANHDNFAAVSLLLVDGDFDATTLYMNATVELWWGTQTGGDLSTHFQENSPWMDKPLPADTEASANGNVVRFKIADNASALPHDRLYVQSTVWTNAKMGGGVDTFVDAGATVMTR